MKKIISLLIAAVMLLSLCTVTAFGANGPMPSSEAGMGGGARIGFSEMESPDNSYVVVDKGYGIEVDNTAFDGATYDAVTNTLTLKDIKAADCSLFIWYMGDDFKLAVEGDCAVGVIYVVNQFGGYNTNLHITGEGTLTLNENKQAEASIWMYGDGEENEQKLIVDDSVTLHLYGSEADDLIINNYGTVAGTAAEAISVGGKGVDGVVGERIVHTDYAVANLMIVYDEQEENTRGYAVKSKSDPNGKYSVEYYSWDDTDARYVSRYVYLDSIKLWVADQSFGGYGSQKKYTKEDFDKEFTIEQSEQPVKIRYTTDEREANKGWELVQLKKAGEPGEIYGGSPIWSSEGSSYDNPDAYGIYHLLWDEEQGVYLRDKDYPYQSVDADDMATEGFEFVYETHTENSTFACWYYPAPFDDDNFMTHNDLIACASDPNGVYVKSGESYSTDENGNRFNESIIVKKVLYDARNDGFYLSDRDNDRIYVPLGEIGGEYSYVTEEVTTKKIVRYITPDYNFNYYSSQATLLEIAGDTSPYCCEPYLASDGEQHYNVHKLELRDNGHYYAVKWEPSDSQVYGHDLTAEKFDEAGYTYVTDMQDKPFTLIGDVGFETLMQYTDAQGSLYGVDWDDSVYAYSEKGVKVTFGDTTYYLAQPSDKSADDLLSSEYEIETDAYHYSLSGAEYHHAGAGGEQPKVLLGDSDGDGSVTILDATAIQRKLANLSVQSYNAKAADADEDGGVTILDATSIQRWLASLPTHEGVGTKWI